MLDEALYWSYNTTASEQDVGLNRARSQFGEAIHQGSEPDFMFRTAGHLVFVEAKFTSSNITRRALSQTPGREFLRLEWEQIGELVVPGSADEDLFRGYLDNKSSGYKDEILQKAFAFTLGG